jgi:oligosaccharide translocation protein RFT1
MIRNTIWLMIFQVFSKIIGFSTNNLLIKYVNPRVLGIVYLRLETILKLIHGLGREGIRLCLLGSKLDKDKHEIVNTVWIGPVISALIWLFVSVVYLIWIPSEIEVEGIVSEYQIAVLCYGLSGMIEYSFEVIYVSARLEGFYATTILLDGIALLIKHLVTILCVFRSQSESIRDQIGWVLMVFGYTQLIYSIWLSMLYYGFGFYMTRRGNWIFLKFKELFPRLSELRKGVDFGVKFIFRQKQDERPLLESGLLQTSRCCLKHILDQGDAILLGTLVSLRDQGIFSIVINYGSLIVRIGIYPIEETFRQFFSQHPQSIESKNYLTIILHVYCYLGMLMICFGPLLIPYLVNLLFDITKTDELIDLFTIYCYYLVLIAINGIFETFTTSQMKNSCLYVSNKRFLGFGILYLFLGFILVPMLGLSGVLVSSIVSTFLRLGYNIWLVKELGYDLRSSVPNGWIMIGLAFVWMATRIPYHIS